MLTPGHIKLAIDRATRMANIAGAAWIESHKTPKYEVRDGFTGQHLGTMIDLCGNAHVTIKDKRNVVYKSLKSMNLITEYGRFAVVEIHHNYESRQEQGLKLACATAAAESLKADGFPNIDIWKYID